MLRVNALLDGEPGYIRMEVNKLVLCNVASLMGRALILSPMVELMWVNSRAIYFMDEVHIPFPMAVSMRVLSEKAKDTVKVQLLSLPG